MSETLGSLLDKLSVLKIRQWHENDCVTLSRLIEQETDLSQEINDFVHDAVTGAIPLNKLTSPAYKNQRKNGSPIVIRDISSLFSDLADVNCELWHDVDKSHQSPDSMSRDEWAHLVSRLATLNLERNEYKESIDKSFADLCKS